MGIYFMDTYSINYAMNRVANLPQYLGLGLTTDDDTQKRVSPQVGRLQWVRCSWRLISLATVTTRYSPLI